MALLRLQTSSVKAVSFATFKARLWREVSRSSLSFWRDLSRVLASSSCLVMETIHETVAHSMQRMKPFTAKIVVFVTGPRFGQTGCQ